MEMNWNRWFISFINTIENVNPWRENYDNHKETWTPGEFSLGSIDKRISG
jgi:hypothetical protein